MQRRTIYIGRSLRNQIEYCVGQLARGTLSFQRSGLGIARLGVGTETVGDRLISGDVPVIDDELSVFYREVSGLLFAVYSARATVARVTNFFLVYASAAIAMLGLRAMAQQPTVARMCGIRVSRVAIVTFMTGAVFAGVAGFLMSSVFMVHPLIGNMIVLKAFTVVILGGMGSVTGAAAAGLMLGIVESMTSAYLGNGLRDIVGFLMVVIVLLAWPQGIFGRKLERS